MIGIDTNVLVRFLVQDDKEQAARATRAIEQLSPAEPGFLSTIVLAEVFWVLTRAYKVSAGDVLATLRELADDDSIVVQDAKQVAVAFGMAAAGADFPAALNSATCAAAGCTSVVSFDMNAVKTLGFRAP